MATLIDTSYFVGDISLPQVGNPIQESEVTNSINTYEPKILKRLLGYDLYTLLQTAWDDYPGTPLPDRFDELINGAIFSIEFRNKTYNLKWDGLINSAKKSLIAYNVYANYMNNEATQTNTTGVSRIQQENALQASPRPKIIYAFNRMVELYGQVPKSRELGFNDFKDKEDIISFWGDSDNYLYWNIEPSAYNFLLANLNTYPEWIFSPIYKKNVLGI